MNTVVCIKQVPDAAEVRINPETGTLIREGVPSIINPFDMHALEAAVSLKEKYGGRVTVITMGPPQAESALREAIAMGAEEAVLLSDKAFAGSDTWATSYALSRAIMGIAPDIIFCGKQAIDGDTAQVGPEIAELLDIPHIAYVRKIEEVHGGGIRVQRLMEEGYDVVESSLPVLLTVVRELNEPRLPSLKGKMAAKKAEIRRLGAKEIGAEEERLGLRGSPTKVKRIFAPEARKDRRMLDGTPEEKVDALVREVFSKTCR